jgi:DNA-binding transcriptional ArsR family regulator
MSFDAALTAFKAAADPTRLRLLAVLATGEATVGELQKILGQSQPRVSRHLRLLGEGELVVKFRDGQSVYYRLASSATTLDFVALVMQLATANDVTLKRDREMLMEVKQNRQRDAFAGSRRAWANAGAAAHRPAHAVILEALNEMLIDTELNNVLDIGCGAGSLMTGLGRQARQVVGVDIAKDMRLLARSRIHQAELANCTVRDADMHALPFDDHAFDLVLLDEVLGLSDKPEQVLCEAVRVLSIDGRLVLLDRVQPVARQLPNAGSDGLLLENQLTALLAESGLRVLSRNWLPGRAMQYVLIDTIPEAQRIGTGTYG